MKKIGIIYFSGTGNTKFAAQNIKEELEENNLEVSLINIEKDKMNIKDYDSLIIGGPVYIDRYPEILIKYIENNLKEYKGECMLFTTQGADKETTAFQHFLNRVKFLSVTYCEYIPMPNNFYNFMFNKLSDEEQKKVIKDSIGKAEKAAKSFIDGKTKFYPVRKIKVTAINMVYKMFYPHLAKIMTRKIKIDKSKCVKCRLCEKRCPVKAIKIEEKAVFNKNCLLCQRCMSNCHKDAFYYKEKKYIQYKPKY